MRKDCSKWNREDLGFAGVLVVVSGLFVISILVSFLLELKVSIRDRTLAYDRVDSFGRLLSIALPFSEIVSAVNLDLYKGGLLERDMELGISASKIEFRTTFNHEISASFLSEIITIKNSILSVVSSQVSEVVVGLIDIASSCDAGRGEIRLGLARLYDYLDALEGVPPRFYRTSGTLARSSSELLTTIEVYKSLELGREKPPCLVRSLLRDPRLPRAEDEDERQAILEAITTRDPLDPGISSEDVINNFLESFQLKRALLFIDGSDGEQGIDKLFNCHPTSLREPLSKEVYVISKVHESCLFEDDHRCIYQSNGRPPIGVVSLCYSEESELFNETLPRLVKYLTGAIIER